MSAHSRKPVRDPSASLTDLKSAPRGLLLYYVLHSVSVKPKHGYEILQDIESRTEGAWRPGVGSVYPILKKLSDRGFVRVDDKGPEETRKVYTITPKGLELVKSRCDAFAGGLHRWMAMRKLYYDMLDPASLSKMFVEGSKKQFEMTKDLLESRRGALPSTELDFMLREYSLNLERQLDWTRNQLNALKPRPAASGRQ